MSRKILYQDISDDLKKKIFQNQYPVGTLMPTENELEALYNVSKITIRNAINLLVSEGYVEKQSGKGTTVISNRLFNKLSRAESFSSILEKRGLKLEKQIIDITEIPADEAEIKFEIGKLTNRVSKISKQYLLDGAPYILFTHYLPFQMNAHLRNELNMSSLYQVLKEVGEIASSFDDTFEGHLLTRSEQSALDTDQVVGIKRIRKAYNEKNQLIEYSIAIYNTTMNPYEIRYEL